MKVLKDEIIIRQIKAGNENTYRQLFDEHYVRLVNIAYKIVGNIDDARDSVQSVFVRIYENRETLEIKTNLKAYLNRSVVNTTINLKNKKSKIISIEESDLNTTNSTEFRDLIEEAESESKIWEAINELPDQCRRIFLMSRFQDTSNEEIALKLNISKRTVETQISKALKYLRNKLLIFITLLF
ncbi:RNA polymerase sigma-70 factor [Salibacteraceae bacterium]|nr:RNA polymerase sigma-70 factor [Salibacteraceae bacterium]MDC1204066.1 RNA polymerase sigma-70 factor [Salibacteraceae bacterium]